MKNEPNEIHFDCPKCKRPLSGDRALLGQRINCPDCGEPFVPTPYALPSAPLKATAPATKSTFNYVVMALAVVALLLSLVAFSRKPPERAPGQSGTLLVQTNYVTVTNYVTEVDDLKRHIYVMQGATAFMTLQNETNLCPSADQIIQQADLLEADYESRQQP